MADYVLYRTEILTRSKRPNYNWIKIVLIILGGIVAGELGFQFIIAPRLVIESITIQGTSNLTKEDVLDILQLKEPLRYSKVQPEVLSKKLASQPWIRTARVEKVFPNQLKIFIEERKPLGMFLVENGSTLEFLALDREFVLFPIAKENIDASLPLFTGIRIEGAVEGVVLPTTLSKIVETIIEIHQKDPLLLSCFSEIRLVNVREGSVEITLYPIQYRVPVRMGIHVTLESLKSSLLVLDVMQKEGLLDKVSEIDFRTGNILYRMQGGDSAGR